MQHFVVLMVRLTCLLSNHYSSIGHTPRSHGIDVFFVRKFLKSFYLVNHFRSSFTKTLTWPSFKLTNKHLRCCLVPMIRLTSLLISHYSSFWTHLGLMAQMFFFCQEPQVFLLARVAYSAEVFLGPYSQEHKLDPHLNKQTTQEFFGLIVKLTSLLSNHYSSFGRTQVSWHRCFFLSRTSSLFIGQGCTFGRGLFWS